MRREKALRQTISIIAIFMLILAFTHVSPGVSFANSGKDYVIVIDVSTSMQDIFDEVKKLAKQTLTEAQVGDNVTLITFGENAELLSRQQIRDKSDIEGIQKQVDALYPTDYATYINRGLARGLNELQYLFEKYPDRERVLLWLSDDKDNPPEGLGQDFLTLDKLREQQKDQVPDREWFAYNAPLSEVKDDALEDFVTWARRTTFRVAVKEQSVDLGSFDTNAVEKTVVLTFEPRHPGSAGLEFVAQARFTDPNDPTKSIPVTVSPEHIVASGHLWQQQFQIEFKGEPGEYKGNLLFESVSGPLLEVEPRSIALTAMVSPPKPPVMEAPPAEEPKREGLLSDEAIIAREDRPPGLTRPEQPYAFGPLEPGKKDSKIITLFLSQEADPESISHDASIQLPPGMKVESKVFGRGTRLAAEITISVDENAPVEANVLQPAYEGGIRFKSSQPGVEVLPVYIPVRVTLNTDRVRWGKRLLPEPAIARTQARRMTFDELTRAIQAREEGGAETASPIVAALRSIYSMITSRYVFIPVMAALVVLLILLVYRMRPASALFAGELIVIKDPGASKMKDVNLKRVGSLHGKDVLTLGSSPKADIRLNHASVAPIHCRIMARTNEDRVEMSIQPVKGLPLRVNDVECLEKARLSDKDLLGVGDFIFLFSSPETQKEIVAHLVDGRTLRGTPVTWDIGASSFELLRSDVVGAEGTTEEISVVNFADLKAVFFMQETATGKSNIPRERINTGELLEVTFFDNEKIEGHPLTEYSDVARRFYLVPREMPNIMSILIERSSTKEVVKREMKGEPEAARPAGPLGFLRKRKGTAPAE